MLLQNGHERSVDWLGGNVKAFNRSVVEKTTAMLGVVYLSLVSPLYVFLLAIFCLPFYWTAGTNLFNWRLFVMASIYLLGYAPPILSLWVACLTCLQTPPNSPFKLKGYQFLGLVYGLIVLSITALYALATYARMDGSCTGRAFLLFAIFAVPGSVFGAVFIRKHLNAQDFKKTC